ncbi:hypothetical protein K470DRAFT_281350 [Piedraia hortae CBS 480.64]|uniref:NEDD8-activating enzyme E1 regulatory subunit n=1 Tax=Piedraia hortae CBS 480.64 TaxID=1314780 RepID=A0A6A7C4A8_9PEZI|nr:hypothetical protein K470DRAFT_281350 [Piedraia hortae CBS 480.64]
MIEASLPPPLQDLPTAKEKKYDRQLRLWGASGQAALEETHLLLINSGAGVVGGEILKNLVLPGLGELTILDGRTVEAADLGVNFFVEDASIGKSRAQEMVRLLGELNPSVKVHAVSQPLAAFLEDESALDRFGIVLIAAPVEAGLVEKVLRFARRRDVPVFWIHSMGFMSSFSVALPGAFPVVETHPDPSATRDLRALTPWEELREFVGRQCAGLEEGTLTDEAKGHIPYLCLLIWYLERWKREHDGNPPKTFKEKDEFRKLLAQEDEENFDEAAAAVVSTVTQHRIPGGVRDILSAPEARDLTKESASFWVIANAIGRFVDEHGELPLPGGLPDMKARSADYIELQNIYKAKARRDCAEVVKHVRRLERELGRLAIDEKEIELFCKGAAHVHLVRGRPFPIAFPGTEVQFGDSAAALKMNLSMTDSLVPLYIAFLAWDLASKIPGTGDYEDEATSLTNSALAILGQLIAQAESTLEDDEHDEIEQRIEKYCRELTRAGSGELHNIAALTGGLVAQEVIKVITHQYIPVDNTCLFDGVASVSQVVRL